MFSFPNAPYRLPTAQYEYTRQGLRSSLVRGPGHRSGCGSRPQDTRQRARDPTHRVGHRRARAPVARSLSATEDWAGDGDGSDLLAAFKTGQLPDQPLDARRLGLAGAVCVSFTLAPGEQRAATFALAWDFPDRAVPQPRRRDPMAQALHAVVPGLVPGLGDRPRPARRRLEARARHRRVVVAGGRGPRLSVVVAGRGAQRALLRRVRRGLLGERVHHQAQAVRGTTRASTCTSRWRPTSSGTASRWTCATTRPATCSSCSPPSSATSCWVGPTW